MSKCHRCSARIPEGRNYCHPHYLEALRDHERALEQYQLDRQGWEQLSVEDRRRQDEQAEAIEVTMYGFFFGLALGGLAWYAVRHLFPIDGLVGLLILGLVTALSTTWSPMAIIVGRLTRALVYAVPKIVVSILVALGLGMISEWIAASWRGLAVGLAVVVVAIGLILEAAGRHHARGEPVPPVEPRP